MKLFTIIKTPVDMEPWVSGPPIPEADTEYVLMAPDTWGPSTTRWRLLTGHCSDCIDQYDIPIDMMNNYEVEILAEGKVEAS